MASGVVAFLLIFWLFIYLPSSRKLKAIKEELHSAQTKIDQINKIVGEKELAQVVTDLTKKLSDLKSKLPGKDEAIISNLSQRARELKVETKKISILGKMPLENPVAGSNIEKLSLSLELSGEFKALGEYIDNLRNNFPVLITIDKLSISGQGEGRYSLDASLQLEAYLSKN
jgi:hypothetical protein